MAQDFDKVRAKTIARAWKDPRFKEKLLKNPKAALKEMGWDVPRDFDVRTFEDRQNTYTFVLPPAIAEAHELSNRELEKLAGGQPRCTPASPAWDKIPREDPEDPGI